MYMWTILNFCLVTCWHSAVRINFCQPLLSVVITGFMCVRLCMFVCVCVCVCVCERACALMPTISVLSTFWSCLTANRGKTVTHFLCLHQADIYKGPFINYARMILAIFDPPTPM